MTTTLTPAQAERARSRVSAFVYGNVLCLAAVAQNDADAVASGRAVLVVAATAVTTYLAHVVAHQVGERVGRDDEDHRTHLVAELRDALPIASSGALPCLVLAAAALGWLDAVGTSAAQLVAVLVVVVRLALTGSVAERLSAQSSPGRTFWSAIALAVAGFLIAPAKVLLLH